MVVNVSNSISSEIKGTRFIPKVHVYTPREALYQSCYERIVKLKMFEIFFNRNYLYNVRYLQNDWSWNQNFGLRGI